MGPAVAIAALTATALVIVLSVFYFIHSAPPSEITISTGPEGSTFQKNALKYAKVLDRNGVKLKVITSKGSLENINRLNDKKSKVDIAMVQGGLANVDTSKLRSLGSISYQPLMIFYRGMPKLELLSQLEGKRVAIGPEGSGVRNFALALLAVNGIKEGGKTTLLSWDAEESAKALLDNKIDLAFVMSESASTSILHDLLRAKGISLFSFKQANAYSRKVDYLNILDLPEGSIDLGLNIPPHDVALLGPMVELVVRPDFNPALTDLMLEAASEVHSKPGIFQRRGEFPAPIEHSIQLSEDAQAFYKSGKGFLFRILPFWLASLITRLIVVLVPVLVVVVPSIRSIPALFRWRMQMKIRRRYRELLELEQEFLDENSVAKKDQLRERFEQIEDVVNKMSVRAAYAEQFYGLRGHIDYVKQLIARKHA